MCYFDHTFDRNYKFQPKFNITESENSYNITADLPGIEKMDVDLSISEGIITISGERKSSDNQEDKFSRFNEIRYGSFEKSFYLPEEANINKINAIMSNGVLSLEIKKSKKIPADIKKISIK